MPRHQRRRGMWMGGRTPLGYAVDNHKLVVVPEDAATVVQLYRRYLDLGTVRALKAALDTQGVVSKPRTFSNGTQAGGTPYSRGALYALLSNPVYRGLVRHKDKTYPGQHQAIVPETLHAAVQARLAESNNGERGQRRATLEPSPLAGKLFDGSGERLVPSHARKGERRYRYYVSASLLRPASDKSVQRAGTSGIAPDAADDSATITITDNAAGWRLPAREIEQAVWSAARGILQQPAALVPDMLAAGVSPERIQGAMQRLAAMAETSGDHVEQVELSTDGMMLTISTGIALDTSLDASLDKTNNDAGGDGATASAPASAIPSPLATIPTLMVSRFVPHRVQRRGVEMRLVIDGPDMPARDDAALLKVVARAHCWFEDLVEGRVASVHDLAARLDMTARYVQRLLPLSLMAPALVERIATGQHPPALTVNRLTDDGPLPIRWTEQLEHLRG